MTLLRPQPKGWKNLDLKNFKKEITIFIAQLFNNLANMVKMIYWASIELN
jgi:hypothetical protein